MFIKVQRRAGLSLLEMVVALGIGTIVIAATVQLYLQTNRAFLSQFNYVDLDSQSRETLDRMSQQIRQATALTNASSTNLAFIDSDGATLRFSYDPLARALIRTKGSNSAVLLKGCDSMQFLLFQRNPVGGNGDFVACTNASACKLIQIAWTCSRDMLTERAHTESIQTAKVMLRNKK